MNKTQVQAEVSRQAAAAQFASAERDAVAAGTMFCLRCLDDELFDRALSSVTGPNPSTSAAQSIVKALKEKARAGYELSAATAELLRLAEAV